MVISVFADDPKEPKLVGETVVDLTTVFEKCEHDGEWRLLCAYSPSTKANLADMFELKYKEMFAGEIYLEMTYFINVSRHRFRRFSSTIRSFTDTRTRLRFQKRWQNL